MANRGLEDDRISADDNGPVGLLAGYGRLPVVFAEKARELGIPVVCAAIRGEATAELRSLVTQFNWISIGQMGRMMRRFKRAGVRRAVMAGKVHKTKWHQQVWRLLCYWPDLRTIRIYFNRSRKNNSDDNITYTLIDEMAKEGITVVSALDYCPELLVQEGVLTRRRPNAREEEDIAFGWEMAKKIGELDIGQSVSVRHRSVLAVEAIEGTDQSILRAGSLCKAGGFVVVKVAKPQQDMRFDVPTVGVATIETMKQAGAKVLAIEAGKTIIIDQKETVDLADRYGITIVAVRGPDADTRPQP